MRTVATDTGFTYNLVAKLTTPMTPGAITASRANMRRDPAVLLLTAIERAETLRSLGEQQIDGRRHNADHLLDRRRRPGRPRVRRRHGPALARSDARRQRRARRRVHRDACCPTTATSPLGARRVKLPYRVTTVVAGETTQDLKYGSVAVERRPRERAPGPAERRRDRAGGASGSGVTLTKLGEDVYYATGGSHHSLFVVFKDHVVVVEAPLNEERSLAVLAKIAEIAPGKPVRYVVPTHYHFDHSGGLRTYIAKGITIVTTPGNKAFVERLARPRTRSGPTCSRVSRGLR